jgi:plasmid stabilization system protein ParE
MKARIQFTPQAAEDLDSIWWVIAEDNRDAADRVEREILATCHRLAKHPRMGTKRQDLTPLPVRFWIVYRPETVPLQVVAVLHGKRDLKEVLESRS